MAQRAKLKARRPIDPSEDVDGVDWKKNAEDSLRIALAPVVFGIGLFVFIAGGLWLWIQRPFSLPMAGLHLLVGTTFIACGLRWRIHPPLRASASASLLISMLYLLSAFAMVAYPDPVLGMLPLFLVAVTAFFIVDPKWMLFAYITGLLSSGLAAYNEPPTHDIAVITFLLVIALLAASSFRVTRISDFSQIQDWQRQAHRRERERRRAADALRESEAALVDAQRIARVGSFVWSTGDDALRWSPEHYRIFGLDPSQDPMTNQDFIDLVHPDDREALVRAFLMSLKDGSLVDIEFRIRRADGEERFLQGRGETDFDSLGRPIRHRGTSHDITERKLSEEALRSSEERLRETLHALDASNAVLLDTDGTIESVLGRSIENNRYGLTPEQVAGASIQDFIPGRDGLRMSKEVRGVFETGRSSFLESVVELAGKTFHFDTTLRPLHDAQGKVDSVLAMVHDVTPRVEAARALEHARRLESLGVLAGGIAHDFNNLLVGILGNADLASRQTDISPEIKESIDQILKSGERAADLTRRLLAYAGRADLTLESIDFPPLIDEIAQLVRGSVTGSASIRIQHENLSAWIRADSTQVGQVVMNLVRNAAEAIGDSGGVVQISTRIIYADRNLLNTYRLGVEAKVGEFVLLDVGDDGIGMDPSTAERIFDPFFTTKFDGRGLGLASTLGIVRGHRGAIRVESDLGVGTLVSALFPLGEGLPMVAEEQPSESARGEGRALLVDDEPAVRRTAQKMLLAQGYAVLDAGSGPEALQLLDGNEFDFALLDVTMPGMDGLELFEAIRAILPGLPVILMSGHSPQDIAGRLSKSDRAVHLQKPFRMATLKQAIQSARSSGVGAPLQ